MASGRGDRLDLLTDGLIRGLSLAGEPFRIPTASRRCSAPRRNPPRNASKKRSLSAGMDAHSAGVPPEDDRTLVIVTLA